MDRHLATFGIWELVLILLIVVVIFGASRLPQLGGALGKAIRNFRGSFREQPREIDGEARKIEEAKKPEELPAGTRHDDMSKSETVHKVYGND